MSEPDRLPLIFVLDDAPATDGAGPGDREITALDRAHAPDLAPDAVIDLSAYPALQMVGPDDELGAIRWNDNTHLMTMLYVQPRHRSRGVATALWRTARNLHLSYRGRDLAIAPQRTVLGEVWMRALGLQAPLHLLAMPMTAERDAHGLHHRLTIPDHRPSAVRDIAERYDLPHSVVDALCEPHFEAALMRIRRKA